jgi:hypothetical protein|tara:strand:- start:6510 stop:6629 length:120 start_codon:yes stop_codon:yes gene_type:complete
MKKNKYEYLLWNVYHTILAILLAGLLIIELLEFMGYGAR